jgi:hypothetical protein
MRATLDQLEFNVIKLEPDSDDPSESKVYLSKRLGREVVDRHRSAREIIQVG